MYTSEYDRKYREGGYSVTTIREMDKIEFVKALKADATYKDKQDYIAVSEQDKKFVINHEYAEIMHMVTNRQGQLIKLAEECIYYGVNGQKFREYLRKWAKRYGYEVIIKRSRGTIVQKVKT